MKNISKKIRVLLGILILLVFFALPRLVAAQVGVPPPSGLVSWWPGDGNANDIQDGNHGTLMNGATFVPGKVGQAFSFDGVNDFVEVADAPNLRLANITVDAWIFPESISHQPINYLLSKGTHAGFTGGLGGWSIGLGGSFEIPDCPGTGDAGELFVFNGLGPADGAGNVVCYGTPLPLNMWTHVAFTNDGSTTKIYVDGQLVAQGAQTFPDNAGVTLSIGRRSDNFWFFKGKVDEVEIFSRALSASEIQGIINQPPNVAADNSSVTVNEGQTATNTGTYSDPDSGQNISITASVGTVNKTGTNSGTWSWSFDTTDGPAQSQAVTIDANDENGETSTVPFSLTVSNVAPTVGAITATATPVQVGTVVSASANFTDPGTLDTHTCAISWDDDATSAGTVTETAGSGDCTATHTYTSAGVYTVSITVTDNNTGVDSEIYQFIVVYDPDAGFVTGGGWINVEGGSCQLTPVCQDATGKGNFGFVSKYKPGAQTPSGETEFQFKAGNLNFHSTSYDWLVVAGQKAQYKGTGTINGGGNYQFLLTAYDGQATGGDGIDKFRIKIIDKDVNKVVFDNKKDASEDIDNADPQAIGGGSIVIHK